MSSHGSEQQARASAQSASRHRDHGCNAWAAVVWTLVDVTGRSFCSYGVMTAEGLASTTGPVPRVIETYVDGLSAADRSLVKQTEDKEPQQMALLSESDVL